MKTFLIVFIALISSLNAYSQTTDKCRPLDDLIGKISSKKRYNYSSVNKIYNLSRTLKCDDGIYAEGMTNIVVQSLALDFVRTIKVAGKNKMAEDFVAGHVGATANAGDLKKVLYNSQSMCPNNKKELCKRIESMAKSGIKE